MFSVSFDRTTTILSAAICAMLLVLVLVSRSMLAGSIGALTIAGAYAYSPRGYRVTTDSIVVSRLIGEARVPLDGLREARRAVRDDFAGTIRLWGSGGMFGYYGLFRTRKLGRCTWYVTNRAKSVVVVTATKTAVFSPDEPDGFLAAIHSVVPQPS